MYRTLQVVLLSLASTVSVAQSAIQQKLPTIVAEAHGRVGFAATHIERNQTISFHAAEKFPMQSVYKLPIAMALLEQVDRRRMKLDDKVTVSRTDFIGPYQHSPIRDEHPRGGKFTIRELLTYAVRESDGSASDVLLRILGGPAVVADYLKTLGIREIHVRDTEMSLGKFEDLQDRNSATPNDAVKLLVALQTGKTLTTASRAVLIDLLTSTNTGQHRIKGDLLPNTIVAHKTGSSRTLNGRTAATNDIGIITLPDGNHIAIAIFVSDSTADDNTRDAVIAKLARTAFDHWTN